MKRAVDSLRDRGALGRALLSLTLPVITLPVITVLAWSLAPRALAQDAAQAPQMDAVAIVSEGQQVSLRWSFPDGVFPVGGFNVVRTSATGSSVTIDVPSPRPWAELVAAGIGGPVITEQTYQAVTTLFDPQAAAQTGEDEGSLALLRAFYTLELAANPELAEAVGLLIHDDEVETGARYSYEVFSAAGERIGSAAITVGSTPALAPPSGLQATATPAGIELIWDRAAEDDLVFAYKVTATVPGAPPTLLTPEWLAPPAPTTDEDGNAAEAPYWFRDEGRAPGETVQYSIVGRDLFGRETPPSDLVVAVMPGPEGLPQPIVVEALAGDRAIELTWALEPDERIVAVGVLRSRDLSTPPVLVSPLLGPLETSWTDADLLGGEDYHYAVAAFDAGGAATISPVWTQRAVNPHGPDAVTGLALEPAAEAMLLRWAAPPQDDVGRYQVYAGRSGATFEEMTLIGETVLTTYSAPIPSNTLFDVAYRVRAVNTSDVAGAASDEVSGRPLDRTPPSAPLWADVIGEEERIALSWLRDLDPDVSFLRLLRADDEQGAWRSLVTDLAPGTTSYVDADVVAGVVYRYALQAVDAAGNESELSEAVQASAWSLAPADPVTGLTATLLEVGGAELSWAAGEPGVTWVVSKRQGDNWLEISDLLTSPGFVDERGQAGASYRLTSYSSTGQAGAPVEVSVGE